MDTVQRNVERDHEVSGRDHVLSYRFDTFDEALDLLKQFCEKYGYTPKQGEIERLERYAGKGSEYIVVVIARPKFK